MLKVDAQVMWGRRVVVRHLPAWNRDQDEAISPFEKVLAGPDGQPIDEQEFVIVIGEDLADAPLVVVNPSTGSVAWAYAGLPAGAIACYVKLARLVCEAQVLEEEAVRKEAEAT